jgi:hypothetical protein
MGSQKQVVNERVLLTPPLTEVNKSNPQESFLDGFIGDKRIGFTEKTAQETFLILTGIGIAVLLMLSIF